ncbi:MAG: helix-turn-helix transcriptional regulator [Lentisphaerae bacterium]|jgi:transcriptional regulator with XRE-family HTH domain|nr:helix-turn-helix transcriptional regulator [Lentisphaerota bacterium]
MKLRNARRARKLSQAALAREAGCTQSAISMMELGRADAISRETLMKLAKILEVDIDLPPITDSPATSLSPVKRLCCPQGECPSNTPFAVAGTVSFWPKHQPAGHNGDFCAYCGEVLLHACPECQAPLNEGGHCARCGSSYVNQPLLTDTTPDAWAASRRQQLAEWRALL